MQSLGATTGCSASQTKDKVLRIAMTAIGDFLTLLDFELFVYLCVYDPEAYEISRRMELESFLQSAMEPADVDWYDLGTPEICETKCAMPEAATPVCCNDASIAPEDFCDNLDDWLKMQDDTFAVTLASIFCVYSQMHISRAVLLHQLPCHGNIAALG